MSVTPPRPIHVFQPDALVALRDFAMGCTNKDEALSDLAAYALALQVALEILSVYDPTDWDDKRNGAYCRYCDARCGRTLAETQHADGCAYVSTRSLLPDPATEGAK